MKPTHSLFRQTLAFLLVLTIAAGPALAQPNPPPGVTPPPTTGPRDPTAEGLGGSNEDELYRCKKYPARARIKVTLKPETELEDLVKWVMGFTCKNFVYGSNINGRNLQKVTIMAPTHMSPQDAYRLFLVALQVMNLTVVDKGSVMELVERPRAKENPLPTYTKGAPGSTDQIVRMVYRPSYMSVDDMAVVFNSLKSKDGLVVLLPAAGAIVITDAGNVIRNMMQVAQDLDQPAGGGERIYMIKVHYADAVQVAETIMELYGQTGRGGGAPQTNTMNTRRPPRNVNNTSAQPMPAEGMPPPGGGGEGGVSSAVPSKILPDERTNSLIVVGTEEAYQRTLALVRRLDTAIGDGDGTIHVYALANADSEEMANTLNSLITGQRAGGTAGGAAGGRRGAAQAPAQAGGAAMIEGTTFEGAVKVTFDKATNSLVIVSSMKDFLALTEVIRKLDRPRRQVFVEATILEVSMDRTRTMGIAFHGGIPKAVLGKDSLIFGGLQHSGLQTLVPALPPPGATAGVRGPEIPASEELLGISIPSFGVQLQLLQSDNDVNVLSSPHILTTDNEEAEIVVGQNIPYQSGTSATSAAGGAGGIPALASFTQPIQRQDVGLKLKITPHVNDSDFVRLEIEQEIEDIASLDFGGNGPSWTTRSVKTTVVVQDQQTVVIGGLMSDKTFIRESKVPLLGDIPILGYLFKHSTRQKTKTNLILFLTPYVIEDQNDIRNIFERKMRERREFLESFRAFKEHDYQPDTDYQRKRGLLAEIDYQAGQIEEDSALRRQAEEDIQRIENRDGPIDGEPIKEPDEPETPPAPDELPTPTPPGEPGPEPDAEEPR